MNGVRVQALYAPGDRIHLWRVVARMDPRIVFIAVFGLALIAAVGLERVLGKLWLSLPIVYVGLGYLLFQLPFDFPALNPSQDGFGCARGWNTSRNSSSSPALLRPGSRSTGP